VMMPEDRWLYDAILRWASRSNECMPKHSGWLGNYTIILLVVMLWCHLCGVTILTTSWQLNEQGDFQSLI
jgi:hypothetical protein